MIPKLFDFTVVVVGQNHNPTILNPDFLRAEEIVPEDWDWTVADTLTTPPFALVQYENGVSVTVEPQKLQVANVGAEEPLIDSKVAEIAAAYVKALPHALYTAVGMNFHSFIEMSEPEEYLRDRFLRSGAWDTPEHPLHSSGLRFVYLPAEDCRVTLAVDCGEVRVKEEEEKKRAILVNANFNRSCMKDVAVEEICDRLSKVESDWKTYQSLIRDVMGTE